jgi:hypothetical protein
MRLQALLLGLALAASPAARGQEAKPPANGADDFVAAEPAPSLPASLAAALQGIKAEALAAHVAFLASPALEGRGLGGRGLEAAAEYAASWLALAGIPALGDSAGYFQPVPVREIRGFAAEVAVETRRGAVGRSRSFASGVDCLLSPWSPQSLTAPMVFAGYGIREPELGHDDYAGLDVRGKFVLILRGVPDGEAWRDPGLAVRYDGPKADERWGVKQETAQALGAAAVLAVEDEGFTQDLAKEAATTTFFLPFDAGSEAPPLARLSPAAGRAALAALGLDPVSARSASPREQPGVTATLRASGSERLVWTRNAIGALPGSDPRLRDEAVVLGAHLDHLGRSGDVVFPGADDNASGVSALLEIARAFSTLQERPKRTLVFAFWAGEEEGKFGSGYYVRHPLWPLVRTTAYVNLDMIGHPWLPEELRKLVADTALPDGEAFLAKVDPKAFTDPGLPRDAPHVEAALRWAGPATGMTLRLDRTDGTHGGSDYRDFARARVPFVRFFGNFFPEYHRAGDTLANLDPAQVQRMARLALAAAWHLADR